MKVPTIAILITSGLFAPGGEISDLFIKQSRDPCRSADMRHFVNHDEVASTNHGITEVGIERTICFGTCPAYTFILKNDGTFRYKGEEYVERKGEFTGTIPLWQFHQLAQFIRDSGYIELADAYSRTVTDHPTVFTTVVMNGKRKVISNYANSGPATLWAIEQLIDDLMAKADWRPPPKIPDRKK